jgi:hypothetical protein
MSLTSRRTVNGKEALQARRDRREAALGRCSGLAGPGHDGWDPEDRCKRGDYYRWRQEFGGLKIEQVKRLTELEI